jgi:hypothetical protein
MGEVCSKLGKFNWRKRIAWITKHSTTNRQESWMEAASAACLKVRRRSALPEFHRRGFGLSETMALAGTDPVLCR